MCYSKLSLTLVCLIHHHTNIAFDVSEKAVQSYRFLFKRASISRKITLHSRHICRRCPAGSQTIISPENRESAAGGAHGCKCGRHGRQQPTCCLPATSHPPTPSGAAGSARQACKTGRPALPNGPFRLPERTIAQANDRLQAAEQTAADRWKRPWAGHDATGSSPHRRLGGTAQRI